MVVTEILARQGTSLSQSMKRSQPMPLIYNHEETKKWVDTWQKASASLDDVKKMNFAPLIIMKEIGKYLTRCFNMPA
jgi:hypothetical protein